MPRCRRCGKKLLDQESVDREYGPCCYKKRSIGEFQIELRFDPVIKRELSMGEQYAIVKRILKSKGAGQTD
jgi:hypothetical protein